MAIFGAPRAHDTDPLRAARAALDIHEALNALGEQASPPLRAHVGIASGEVVAGPLGRADVQDYTVLGDPVNLAARLVAAAGPGETLLSDSVHRALGDDVMSDAVGEMRFKGIDSPVRVWRLRGLAFEPVMASRSVFVGRKAELEQFKGVARACLEQRAGHVVYVRGEAGIGKTRLVDEMRRFVETLGFAQPPRPRAGFRRGQRPGSRFAPLSAVCWACRPQPAPTSGTRPPNGLPRPEPSAPIS